MDGQPLSPRHPDRRPIGDDTVADRRGPWLVLLVKIAVAAAIIAWLCTGRLEIRRLAEIPFSFDLVLLAAIVFGSMLLPAVRWWWLLRIQRIEVSLWRVIALTWFGYFAALVLPGAAGGDLARSYLIVRRQREARARSLSTVLVDRMIGVYSLALLGCTSAAWYVLSREASPTVWWVCYTMAALFAGLTPVVAWVVFARPPRWLAGMLPLAWAEAWRDSSALYNGSKWALAGCLVLSLASNVLVAISLAAADRVLGGGVSWMASLFVGPLVVLANCLPFTPGGLGVAEAAASELFQQVGSADGAEMMLAIRLVMATLSLPALGLLFARNRTSAGSIPREESEAARNTASETGSPLRRAA